jgi:hypothetical protein
MEHMGERWKEIQRRLDEEMREELLSVQALSPLPRRRVPWPWEDLASLISRTAEAMGYASPGWILHPESVKYSIAPDEISLLSGQADYQMLGRFLGLDESTLRSLTLHRFSLKRESEAETAHTTKETQFHIWGDDPLFRSFKRTVQVCPSCLDEQKSYDRLYWRARPLLLCPRHRVFLIQSCPVCQRPIPTPRLHLSLCKFCGSDYRKHIVPLPPEADWLLSTNIVFLTRLGVDTSELGRSPANHEASLLHDLSPYEYRWMITKLSVLFEDALYRKKFPPFLLRALPVDELVPDAPQNPYLILHYLLASWPVHWWVFLERLQHAFQQDSLWRGSLYSISGPWEKLLAESECWAQEVSKDRTISILHAFFDTVEKYFQSDSRSHKRWNLFGERITSSEVLLARQLRIPRQEDLVSPRPWEDLASVISRVARNMHYEDPTWLLISQDAPHLKIYSQNVPVLCRRDDYRLLERQLGLDREELYRLTLHRLAPRLQHSVEGEYADSHVSSDDLHVPASLADTTSRRYCASLRDTKVCPACLEEEIGYDRLYWRLSPVVLCPEHAMLLIDCCPHCRAPIPSFRPGITGCPYCQKGDYRHAQRRLIPTSSWLYTGQVFLLHQLTSEHRGQEEGPTAFVDSPVLLIAPWQYFTLWEHFDSLLHHLRFNFSRNVVVQALEQLAWDGDALNGVSWEIQMQARKSALFHFLLASWPENVLSLLDTIASESRVQWSMGSLRENFWQFDQLVQHLWSSIAHDTDCFTFLTHLFETLHLWEILSLR